MCLTAYLPHQTLNTHTKKKRLELLVMMLLKLELSCISILLY